MLRSFNRSILNVYNKYYITQTDYYYCYSQYLFKLLDIIKDYLKFQDEPFKSKSNSFYSSSSNSEELLLLYSSPSKLNYKHTAFLIELMLIDGNDERRSTTQL